MTRIATIARSVLGRRPLVVPRDHVTHETGALAMARYILSLPAMAERWRAVAAEIRAAGDDARAVAIEACAADLLTNERPSEAAEGRK